MHDYHQEKLIKAVIYKVVWYIFRYIGVYESVFNSAIQTHDVLIPTGRYT